jgi:hypothetical protein
VVVVAVAVISIMAIISKVSMEEGEEAIITSNSNSRQTVILWNFSIKRTITSILSRGLESPMVEVEISDKSSNSRINPNNTVVVISTRKDNRTMVLRHNSHSNRNTVEVEVTSIMKVHSQTTMEEATISLLGMEVKSHHIMVEVVEIGKTEVVMAEEVEEGMAVEEVDLLKNLGKRNSEEIVVEDITEVDMEEARIKMVFNKIFRKDSKSKVLNLSVKNLKRRQLFLSSLLMTISM